MIKTKSYQSFDPKTGDFIYHPVKYLDFHCSIEEWKRLSSGKKKFIYQLREKLFGIEKRTYYDSITKNAKDIFGNEQLLNDLLEEKNEETNLE